jgi:hypothetical protein
MIDPLWMIDVFNERKTREENKMELICKEMKESAEVGSKVNKEISGKGALVIFVSLDPVISP